MISVRPLELLGQRIEAGRGDSSVPRDPDFIRRQLPAIARHTSYFTPEVRGLDRLPALEWTAYGPGAADDAGLVSACYLQITGQMQAALDRLSAEQPHPLLTGCARLGQKLGRTALATSSGLRSISASP